MCRTPLDEGSARDSDKRLLNVILERKETVYLLLRENDTFLCIKKRDVPLRYRLN